ncbi:MAG: M48 family metallopeptidase [Erythrobacter sp.]|nr:MAG: M48 family metallopeptidase [Erythrobacter sp.]
MLDWLRGDHRDPAVEVAGRTLPIAIRRHPRSRRLTMRLAPDGSELRVTMPGWGRTLDALTFARARVDWIAAQLERVPESRAIGDGSMILFRGEGLTICWQADGLRRVRLVGNELHLGGPADRLAARLQRWLESEALNLLCSDLAYYCDRAGLNPPQLRLSRAQRRWGSCSGERSTGRCIRINWRLVMAPDYVRQSVVAHEVAHLVHFDHSPRFYALLAGVFDGDLPAADRWLKAEGRSLYTPFG